MATLTNDEKTRVLFFLGYPATQYGLTLIAGLAEPREFLYMVTRSMELLTDDGAIRVRAVLAQLEIIEQRLATALPQLSASAIGDMKLRGAGTGETVTDALERESCRWAQRLADLLGCQINPNSSRYAFAIQNSKAAGLAARGAGVNAPRIRS